MRPTCSGCDICINLCPYHALERDKEKGLVRVVEALCQGLRLRPDSQIQETHPSLIMNAESVNAASEFRRVS